MRLNLRKKQKANYSTTYKRKYVRWGFLIFLLAVLFFCIVLFLLKKNPSEEEKTEKESQEQNLPDGEAEMLLVYGKDLTDTQTENIRLIVEAATQLNHSMDFGTPNQCVEVLGEYDYLICYDLDDPGDEFLTGLEQYKGKLFMVGKALPDSWLEKKANVSIEEIRKTDAGSGVAAYTFQNGSTFEKLIHAEEILCFPDPDYENGTLTMDAFSCPLFSRVGTLFYCPLSDLTSEMIQAAFLQELTDWMWIYDDRPNVYAQYLVLDQIYAFMPTDQLMEKINLCVDAGLPFVLSVMPVYQNGEYPAMQQFCECLKYAQANGGAVILHAPLQNGEIDDWEEYKELITEATVAYTNWGVYPLGIEVEKNKLSDQDYLEFLKRYQTLFVCEEEEEDEESTFDFTPHKNLLYYNYHQLVWPVLSLDDTGISYLSNYSSAVYLNVMEDVETIETQIKRVQASAVPLKSLWDLSHSVWGDDFHLEYEDRVLSINGEEQDLSYEPEDYPEDFNYNRNTLKRITVSLENQNRGLILIVGIVTMLFLGFIVYARILNRRHFFYDEEEKEKREE